jgi:hypothetical protein
MTFTMIIFLLLCSAITGLFSLFEIEGTPTLPFGKKFGF